MRKVVVETPVPIIEMYVVFCNEVKSCCCMHELYDHPKLDEQYDALACSDK